MLDICTGDVSRAGVLLIEKTLKMEARELDLPDWGAVLWKSATVEGKGHASATITHALLARYAVLGSRSSRSSSPLLSCVSFWRNVLGLILQRLQDL